MSKGRIEARISESVSRFEVEFMGRGPKKIRAMIVKDLLIIRLQGFLSQAEQKLVETNQGVDLWKKMRAYLFENNITYFQELIRETIPLEIVSIHSDVSTRTGEKMIIVVFESDIEEYIEKN